MASGCLSYNFFCCDKTSWLKATCGGKGVFDLVLKFELGVSPSASKVEKGIQDKNLEAAPDAEAREEYCHWLIPHVLLNLPSYTIQSYQPRAYTTHKEQTPYMSIIHQENVPQACTAGNVVEPCSQ